MITIFSSFDVCPIRHPAVTGDLPTGHFTVTDFTRRLSAELSTVTSSTFHESKLSSASENQSKVRSSTAQAALPATMRTRPCSREMQR